MPNTADKDDRTTTLVPGSVCARLQRAVAMTGAVLNQFRVQSVLNDVPVLDR